MSTIRSTAWRKRGTTNDPVSFRRRRCHRHCHHCCNWRDPWHRTLALARDLSARQLILAPHTIAVAKPLNLALSVSLQKLVATATISRAREFSSIAWRSSDGCKQMFGGKEQSLGGRGRATKGHDNDCAQILSRRPMLRARRNDRRNRDPLLLPPTLRPRIGLRRKTIARNSPRAVQVVPGLLITSRGSPALKFVKS